MPRRVGGIAHGTAHLHEPVLEQGACPLDVPLAVTEAEDARDIMWVVLFVANELERDAPRPAHADDDEARGREERVDACVRRRDSVGVDGVKCLPMRTARKNTQKNESERRFHYVTKCGRKKFLTKDEGLTL